MAVTSIMGNHFKYALATSQIDLSEDIIKVLLMRSGFVFDRDKHKVKKNIKGTFTGSSNVDFTNSNSTISCSAGGFIDAGFVVGNQITISNTTNNNVVGIIQSVTDTAIVTDATLTDETGTSATITANDELAAGNGYTQDDKTTGTITLTEDDTYDALIATFPTVTWTASGGDIGGTPGALLYDADTEDGVIIGYMDFGGDQTANDGETFNIASGTIKIL